MSLQKYQDRKKLELELMRKGQKNRAKAGNKTNENQAEAARSVFDQWNQGQS